MKYYFDDIKGVFVPPATPASHLQNGLNGLNTNSSVVPRGIAAMGEVKSNTYRVINSVTVVDNKIVKPENPKPEVEEPKPPVTNPEIPNEAPVANPDTVTVTA